MLASPFLCGPFVSVRVRSCAYACRVQLLRMIVQCGLPYSRDHSFVDLRNQLTSCVHRHLCLPFAVQIWFSPLIYIVDRVLWRLSRGVRQLHPPISIGLPCPSSTLSPIRQTALRAIAKPRQFEPTTHRVSAFRSRDSVSWAAAVALECVLNYSTRK
jgi:hypothetical protein